jgi:hypothetical protein
MDSIHITPTSENVVSKTTQQAGGYLEIVERVGVDQHGHEWRSFHSRIVLDPDVDPDRAGEPDSSEAK